MKLQLKLSSKVKQGKRKDECNDNFEIVGFSAELAVSWIEYDPAKVVKQKKEE